MNQVIIFLSRVFVIYLPFKSSKYNTIYGILFGTFYIIYSCVMIYLVQVGGKSSSLTSLIQSFMLMFANLILMYRTSFASKQLFLLENTLDDIVILHASITDSKNTSALYKHSTLLFIGSQILFLLFYTSSYFVWGNLNILPFLMQILPEYIYLTVFMLQWTIMNTLQGSIKSLNKELARTFLDYHQHGLGSNVNISIVRNLDGMQLKLNAVMSLVEKQNDIVFYFNAHFGWNLLLSTLIAVHYLLGFVSELFKDKKLYIDYEIFAYIAQFYSMCQGVMIPIKGERIMQQRNIFINLLRKVMHRYLKYPALENKLTVLMQQTGAEVNVSAAGFFNLNYAMIFTFVNMIITYLIVIIQIK